MVHEIDVPGDKQTDGCWSLSNSLIESRFYLLSTEWAKEGPHSGLINGDCSFFLMKNISFISISRNRVARDC